MKFIIGGYEYGDITIYEKDFVTAYRMACFDMAPELPLTLWCPETGHDITLGNNPEEVIAYLKKIDEKLAKGE